MLRQSARFLLPALIEYISKMAPLMDDGSISEQHLTAIGEVWKAFTVLFASLPEDQRKFSTPSNYAILNWITLRNPHPEHLPTNHCPPPSTVRSFPNAHPHPKRLPASVICHHLSCLIQRSHRKTRSSSERTAGAERQKSSEQYRIVAWRTRRTQTTNFLKVVLDS
jgi:hypothetical protein